MFPVFSIWILAKEFLLILETEILLDYPMENRRKIAIFATVIGFTLLFPLTLLFILIF